MWLSHFTVFILLFNWRWIRLLGFSVLWSMCNRKSCIPQWCLISLLLHITFVTLLLNLVKKVEKDFSSVAPIHKFKWLMYCCLFDLVLNLTRVENRTRAGALCSWCPLHGLSILQVISKVALSREATWRWNYCLRQRVSIKIFNCYWQLNYESRNLSAKYSFNGKFVSGSAVWKS